LGLDTAMPNPKLGLDMSTLNPKLGLTRPLPSPSWARRVRAQSHVCYYNNVCYKYYFFSYNSKYLYKKYYYLYYNSKY
jgi:hypothetical protein